MSDSTQESRSGDLSTQSLGHGSETPNTKTLPCDWEVAIDKHSGNSLRFLNLLTFFEPGAIPEQVLREGSRRLHDADFAFLGDDLGFKVAEAVLIGCEIVSKNIEDATLSIDPRIQSSIIQRLTEQDRTKYFDTTVRLLSWGFPDTWTQDIRHQFQQWTKCEKILPHVNHLIYLVERWDQIQGDAQSYGELLLRCSWYLYERERYREARSLARSAAEALPNKRSLSFASAIDLSGLIDLDMNKPTEALISFDTALKIRESLLDPTDLLVAASFVNLALAYTAIPDLEKAWEFHQKALGIRLQAQSDRIGNSYSNMASLLLLMGKPDEAEEMLKRCPSLQNFTDETFISTGNPRFSGDMVLLSRIRVHQGRIDDALRLATKALAFRQRFLGNGLKVCDSLYDVAGLLHRHEKTAEAIETLLQLVTVAETLDEGQGQLARAIFKLFVLYGAIGMEPEMELCKERALKLRGQVRPELVDAPFEEEEFVKLCPWMLW